MHLDAWIKKEGLSQAEFGASLNPPAPQSLVSQWINGLVRVTLERGLEIRKRTRDEVSLEEINAMFRADRVPVRRAVSNAAAAGGR